MRFVIIEEKVLEELLSTLDGFVHRFERTFGEHVADKPNRWLDTQDVCLILSISKRAVQSLRSSGKLPSSKIGKKSYYKPEDIQKLIPHDNDKR